MSATKIRGSVGSQFEAPELTEAGYTFVSTAGYFETKDAAIHAAEALRSHGVEPWLEYNAHLERSFTAWAVCFRSEYRA